MEISKRSKIIIGVVILVLVFPAYHYFKLFTQRDVPGNSTQQITAASPTATNPASPKSDLERATELVTSFQKSWVEAVNSNNLQAIAPFVSSSRAIYNDHQRILSGYYLKEGYSIKLLANELKNLDANSKYGSGMVSIDAFETWQDTGTNGFKREHKYRTIYFIDTSVQPWVIARRDMTRISDSNAPAPGRNNFNARQGVIGHWISDKTMREVRANLDTGAKQENDISIQPYHMYFSQDGIVIVDGGQSKQFRYRIEVGDGSFTAPNTANVTLNDGSSFALSLSDGNKRMRILRNISKGSSMQTPYMQVIRTDFTYVDDKQAP